MTDLHDHTRLINKIEQRVALHGQNFTRIFNPLPGKSIVFKIQPYMPYFMVGGVSGAHRKSIKLYLKMVKLDSFKI